MPSRKRKLLTEAHRVRSGRVALLMSCLCAYPLREYQTVSGHDEGCPAHAMYDSLTRAQDPDGGMGA